MTDIYRANSVWRERVVMRRSARARYARLKIHPDSQVEVVVPRGFDERQLPSLLDQHESWVLRHLQRLQSAGTTPLQPVAAPGKVQLAAIAEQWDVTYLDDESGRYGCRAAGEGVLKVSGGHHWQPSLKRWLVRKGRQHLVPWLEQVSAETGLAFRGATVRCQRSRWGSCSSRSQINLNAGLLFVPPELVRYLFVHELCHTRHMNHSASYWRLVARMEPDYRALDRALRQAGKHLPSWLHARAIAAVRS
ncbi:MAG: M48 family metallopeptidase [Gammaproteobacteria bacterium]|nr:M48 family metallopeptidase [Gammaproteobacteria bacterium]